MSISNILTNVAKQAKVHSPEILTALGVTGVVTTSYLTAKAAVEAAKEIDFHENQSVIPLSNKEKFKLVWRSYIPAAASGVLTTVCIIGASQASGRRTAAAVTAFTVTEKAFSEYKEKVVEQIGINKEQKIKDEIVQDAVKANPPSTQVIFAGSGHVLCCELFTKRYFRSDMETLKKAQNEVNEKIYSDLYVMMSEFYDLIGLPHTSHSDYVGWDSQKPMELLFSAVLSDGPDPEPCMGFDYNYTKPL